MFLSVKERAKQIANGQLTSSTPINPVVEPPTKATTPPKATLSKATTAKAPSPKVTEAKAAPPKPSVAKAASPKRPGSKTASAKPPSPKPIGAFPDNAPSTPKLKRSKTEPPRAASPKKSSSKDTPSRPKPSRTESSKSVSSKKTPTKAATKSAAATPVRSSFFSRIASSTSSADSSTDEESPKAPASDEITQLKAACMKQISGVTGLSGKNLAVVCRQTSSNRQWYAALKDLGSDKYLKMWMNRERTYPTQKEALEAYLVFTKKMKDGCRLFPMAPGANKSK